MSNSNDKFVYVNIMFGPAVLKRANSNDKFVYVNPVFDPAMLKMVTNNDHKSVHVTTVF